MKEKPSRHITTKSGQFLILALFLALILTMTGCTAVPAYEQAELSRPGMLFSNSPSLSDSSSLIASVEPGTDERGGAAASGCTICR